MVKQGDGHRYSVRASITLWIAIAGFIWVTIGLALTYATHWGQSSLEADASRLSTIAPAAGSSTSSSGN
jgi:hypothetical protein